MPKINLQLFATREEILNLIQDSMNKYNLYLVTCNLFPKFQCELINQRDIANKKDLIESSRFIYLYNYKPNLSIIDYWTYIEENSDFLSIDIPESDTGTLKEISIGTITNNTDTFKIWNSIIRRFKKTLQNGAWIYSSRTGNNGFNKNIKYTIGAKKLYEQGIKMLPIVGYNEYLLTETLNVNIDFSYIKVFLYHHFDDEPVILYSELDKDRYEVRKVEVYKNGLHCYASLDYQSGDTLLSERPLPSIEEIKSDHQFLPETINKDEFNRIWEIAINNFYEG